LTSNGHAIVWSARVAFAGIIVRGPALSHCGTKPNDCSARAAEIARSDSGIGSPVIAADDKQYGIPVLPERLIGSLLGFRAAVAGGGLTGRESVE
jgi:hypothetical protein